MINSIAAKDVNRITSGQVIIDLKSIVKEFIENAIDANANNIEIIFTNYGVDQISVQDNGTGITPEDFASLCLRSHTSKLSLFEDLSALNTLGFRGEALNSICSMCSKVRVVTTPAVDSSFNKIYTLEYSPMGVLTSQSHKPTKQTTGTTVIVEKLFHNLPVRHKNFIKNSKKEFHKAINFIVNYMLIFPEIKFNVVNMVNGKKVVMLNSKGGEKTTILDNIITIFGNESARGILELDLTVNDEIQITGYISNHSFGYGGRTSIDRQFIYINKRPVYMKRLSKMVNETYRLFNQLQNPIFVLNLNVNSDILDVNLTPDKTRVLIHEESRVLEEIQESLVQFYESQNNVHIPKSQIKIEQILLSQLQDSDMLTNSDPNTDIDLSVLNSNPDSTHICNGTTEEEEILNLKDDTSNKDQYIVRQMDIEAESGTLFVQDDAFTDLPSSTDKYMQEENDHNAILPNKDLQPKQIPLFRNDNSDIADALVEDVNINDTRLIENSSSVPIGIDRIKSYEVGDSQYSTNEINPLVDNLQTLQPRSTRLSQKRDRSSTLPHENKETQRKLDISQISSTFRNDFEEDVIVDKGNDNYGENFNPIKDDEVRIEIGDQEWWQPSFKRLKREELHKLKSELCIDKSELEVDSRYQNGGESSIKLQVHDIANSKEQEENLSYTISKRDFLEMKIIGQFNLGFVLVSLTQHGITNLFIVDQHASDEKYNFEKLSESFEINQQQLIRPQTVELSIVEEVLVIDNKRTFHQNGFRFDVDEDAQPGKRITLTSLPNLKGKAFDMDDFNELINIINANPNSGRNIKCSKIRSICAMKACRSLIMIGQALTKSAMEQIVRNLASLNKPWNCPHGRPTMRHLVELKDWKNNNFRDYQLKN